MRWARPSTTAVLPTPGSPMSTGLFLVRRDSTCTTRRISASRPMTGSSLPSLGAGGQVDGVLLERLVRRLGVLAGHPPVAADGVDRLAQRLLVDPGSGEQLLTGAVHDGQREQQVLGGDVVVLHVRDQVQRLGEHPGQRRRRARASAPSSRRPWAGSTGPGRAPADRGDVGAGLGEQRRRDALLLAQQRDCEVDRLDLGVALVDGEGAGGVDHLDAARGELGCVHVSLL